ncbi:MAG: molybdopterin-dependent oxidoreductase, partial [Kofleriaceae bacterium]|nr:molybdopterin-dependent oxidoreductase [Kofleriaceae bacterium]
MMKTKQEEIVIARQKLRQRFAAKQSSDIDSQMEPEKMGSGALNRHGMPTCPPGQTLTKKWPVLDLGIQPSIDVDKFRLELRGLCHAPATLSFEQLRTFEEVRQSSDFHCVTTWSRLNLEFVGVRLSDIIASADIDETATHIMCY